MITKGWEKRTLGEVCEIIGGNPAPKTMRSLKTDGVPFVTMKDLGSYHFTCNLIEVENRVSDEVAKINKLKLINKGSILLPRSGSVALNHRAILGLDAYMVSHICALEIKNPQKLFNKYLYYYLVTIDFNNITKKTTGLDAITFQDLSNVIVPIPPISIQEQIVEILETADQAKQKRQEANKLTEQFLQAVFIEMFGDPVKSLSKWEKIKIRNLTHVKTGGTPSRVVTKYFDGKIPWVKTSEVNNNIIMSTEENITEEALKDSNCVIFPRNTVLIALYGQGLTRGRTAILGINACTNQACAAILPSSKIDSIFLWYQLRHFYLFLRDLSRGGNQPNLNLNFIKELEIINPPLNIQEQFAKIVLKADKLKEKQKESEQELDNLFSSLMQKAFNGNLF